jgi:hypothetical protein
MNCDPVYAISLTLGGFMKKSMACLSALLLLTSGALAANDAKEVERVKEAGEVLKEILNIPDDIRGRWKLRPRRHGLPQR